MQDGQAESLEAPVFNPTAIADKMANAAQRHGN